MKQVTQGQIYEVKHPVWGTFRGQVRHAAGRFIDFLVVKGNRQGFAKDNYQTGHFVTFVGEELEMVPVQPVLNSAKGGAL